MPHRIIFTLSTILFATLTCGCDKSKVDNDIFTQDPQTNPVPSQKNIQFTHTFPPLIAGLKPTAIFTIPVINKSAHSIIFDEHIIKTCSCSAAELKSHTLDIGEQTELIVSMNIIGRVGQQRVVVSIIDSDEVTWSFVVEVMIYPQTRFSVQNNSLHIPSVDPGTKDACSVDFDVFASNSECLPKDIALKCNSNQFSVSVIEASSNNEITKNIWNKKFKILINFNAPSIAGNFYSEVVAGCVIDNETRSLSLNISGNVRNLIDITPAYVFFAAESDIKRIAVKRKDGKKLIISNVKPTDDSINYKIIPTQNEAVVMIEFQVNRRNLNKLVAGEIVFESNIDAQRSTSISFACLTNSPLDNRRK